MAGALRRGPIPKNYTRYCRAFQPENGRAAGFYPGKIRGGTKENAGAARLDEEEMHHARDVMRMKPGEEVTLIIDDRLFLSAFSPSGKT